MNCQKNKVFLHKVQQIKSGRRSTRRRCRWSERPKGIKAQSLTSQDPEHIRELAIQELEAKRLEVIVTVDIFNEGVDIPCLNQIILLRPTQSAIVYIQQLGRGLRKYHDKKFVVILDFIANYENNFLIPVALSGDNSYDKDELKKFVVAPNNFISGKSTITFTSIAKSPIHIVSSKLTAFCNLLVLYTA